MKLHSRTQLFAQVSIPPQHRRSRCFLARRPSCAGASSNTSNILAQQHQRSTVASQHSSAMAPHRAPQQLPQELTPSRRFRTPGEVSAQRHRSPASSPFTGATAASRAPRQCTSHSPESIAIAAGSHQHRIVIAIASPCAFARSSLRPGLRAAQRHHGWASSCAIATRLPRQVACCARVRLFLRPSQPALQQLTHHLTLLQPPISFFSPQPCFAA